jgi:5'-nucleotidase
MKTKSILAAVLVGALAYFSAVSYGADRQGKITFTILHTNDLHSAFIGLGPASDYTPFTLNDDKTCGGYSRLASLISLRKRARKDQGPVLVLDAGDYCMGSAFGAATREIGGELQIMGMMGIDATTFGNHEFDYGAEGLGKSIVVAAKAGRIPAVLASNTHCAKDDVTLADLKRLEKAGLIRRYKVIERGGIRFGLFGVLGKGAAFYANKGAVTFSDAIEDARELVRFLRERKKVDVVIALSHGGVQTGKDGYYSQGDDVRLAKEVPGIDVVIGAHSHTEMQEAIIVNNRTPVVQTGSSGRNLGELVITLNRGKLNVESYKLCPVNDSIAGDKTVADAIDKLKKKVTATVFASRGYDVDQPLAIAPRDLPNWSSSGDVSPILANLVTDAFREATKADIGFHVVGLMRTGLTRGKTGVQTVYDIFSMAPLGYGVVDTTAGSALVTGYFTGQELKTLLEFFLQNNPDSPGETSPCASGMKFRYDLSRPTFDVVTGIELGDYDHGYKSIDTTGKDQKLYSLSCPLMLGKFIVDIPKVSQGKLALVPKNKNGQPLKDRVEALAAPRQSSGYLLPPPGTTMDKDSVDTTIEKGEVREIKEWQAIMDHLRRLPVKSPGELPVIPVDERASEVRAIKAK